MNRHLSLKWVSSGLLLLASSVVVLEISVVVHSGRLSDSHSGPILAALLMVAGILYWQSVRTHGPAGGGKKVIAWILLIGLFMRLCLFFSLPILESDPYRYLWDGGLVANGHNPYEFSPKEIRDGGGKNIPEETRKLGDDAREILNRINHPWLKTVYPPLVQLFFAMAHYIAPWSLAAWRLVLLAADLTALYLLARLLRFLHLPMTGLVIYWWNPLLVKETYNACHMDVVILPFIIGALLLTLEKKSVFATLILGLSFGIKFWPVFLLPLSLRPVYRDPRRLIGSVLLFVGLSVLMLLPYFTSASDSPSGLKAYLSYWEMNDALFMLILWPIRTGMSVFGLAGQAQIFARLFSALIVLVLTLWMILNTDASPDQITRQFLLITATVFLLGPAQFPWYYIWAVPLLAVIPKPSLMLLTVLLPLYYLRFFFDSISMVKIHDYGIVWIEFGPVIYLLLREEWAHRRSGQFCR